MSETQNNIEEPDNLEQSVRDGSYHDALDEAKEQQERAELAGVERIELPPTPLVQAREVILPVIMRKGEDIAILGEAKYDPETSKMVVHYNTPAGRDIAEFIGAGMLVAVSFNGHMSKSDFNS